MGGRLRACVALVGLLGAGAFGCDSILGIGDPSIPSDAGVPGSSGGPSGASSTGSSASSSSGGRSDGSSAGGSSGGSSSSSEGGPEAATEGGPVQGPDATLPDSGPGTSSDASGSDTGIDDASADGACTNECTTGSTRCDGGSAEICSVQTSGCTEWTTSATCGSNQACTVSAGTASCTCNASLCTEAGTACQDAQTLATCLVDGDGCPYVASTSTCQSTESCSGSAPNAACSPTCTNSCSPGQTMCTSDGMLSTCTMGSNGCWAYGSSSACPDVRQSCTGTSGSAVCTCNPDPVCTSTVGVCTSATTAVSCAQDEYGCFYETTTTICSGATPYCNEGGSCGPCSAGAPSNYGEACTAGDESCPTPGTIGCSGSCSAEAGAPANYGDACTAGVGACENSGTIECSGSCSAQPGTAVSGWQDTPAPNGSWDWNCDGVVEMSEESIDTTCDGNCTVATVGCIGLAPGATLSCGEQGQCLTCVCMASGPTCQAAVFENVNCLQECQ